MSPSTAHDHVGEEPCFTAIIDGLTKRELFAAMAMQGLCASHTDEQRAVPALIAAASVLIADNLIAELSK